MRAFSFLLVLLALVCAAGGVNYRRNEHLDKDLQFRPYAGLDDADLATLMQAHEQRATRMSQSLRGQGPDAAMGGIARSDYGSRVKAFEHFQRENERWKEGRRELLDEQVTVEALRKEQQVRSAGLDRFWMRIFRRATTF